MRGGLNPVVVSVALVAVVSVAGAGIALLPNSVAPEPAGMTVAPLPSQDNVQFTKEFIDGVKLLRGGQFDAALVLFESARKRRPHSPSVWVNIGYTLLAKNDNAAAVEAFTTALNINPKQVNGYYGLALAQEAQGEFEAALGAMRTYRHLAPTDTDFYRKASSAIWEWEAQMKARK